MSKYSIDSTTLTGIANAIRAKDGSSSPIVVSDFATKITNIPTSNGDSNFTSPYNNYISFPVGAVKILGNSYGNSALSQLIIPYEIWSQYSSIYFKYVVSNGKQVANSIPGSKAKIVVDLARMYPSNTWSLQYMSFTPLNLNNPAIDTVLNDFTGSISDIYTINCNNIEITDQNYNNILIHTAFKPYDSSDSSSNITFAIGEFGGVLK